MNPLYNEEQSVATGLNALLGRLVCYSCQRHTRLYYDKTLRAERSHRVYVFRNGALSIGCDCCTPEFLQSVIQEVESISQTDLVPFGQGVAIEFFGKRMECAQCGSEEFCELQDADQPPTGDIPKAVPEK